MLTSETKQKINNCRDYLVGKIPDPKWQIDQITNALIYKFMSDQDRLAKEIGWNASFFVDQWEKESEKYKKYSWEHLFDTKLTNEAKAKLYIDGIEQLSKAKHLPELFRDIFKNAFLPFRDANTIVLFLTEINKFDYHHSEELGNAFEYLLSIMGSQWNAGQFRTPRHIIEFLVDVVDPKPGETIYDPACWTAGFLISAFTHIMENNPKLSVPEKLELYKNISWVDIDPGMAKIARVNLYLHGFKTPKISEDDTLSNIKLWENKYDVILANPPFMTPKWGIKVHEWYSIKSTKAEVLFTDYIAEHLRLKWRAGIIVPEWIIFTQANAYKTLRKMLVEQNLLYAVVSLPSWIFQPYSWVKTSILFLDRELASKTDKILFVKVENDGYDLWAQRREINKNDLPKSLEIFKNYKASILENKNFETDDKNVLVVEKSKIKESWDYNLSMERYRENIFSNNDYDMIELDEVLDYEQPTNYIVDSVDYKDEYKTPVLTAWKSFILWYTNEENWIFPKEKLPVIIFDDFTTATKFVNFPFKVKSSAMKILHAKKEKASINYLYYIIQNIKFPFTEHKRYWISQYSKIKIPLPPLEVQEQIVEELDNYQKIIDGAKQIVENYKPKIKIDESWEVVELGNKEYIEIIDWDRWVNYPKKEEFTTDWYCLFLNTSNVRKWVFDFSNLDFITKEKDEKLSKWKLKKWDLVLTTRWTLWNTAYFDNSVNFENIRINSWMVVLRPNIIKVLWDYLLVFLNSENFINQINSLVSGSAQPQLPIWTLKYFKIPLPPLEIQEQIVAKIEEEQKMVESAKWLIEVFEGKIRDRIWEVWGENLDDNI